MRKTLEDLYYGNITPSEQRMTPGSEMEKAVARVTSFLKQLMEQLEETEQGTLTKLIRSQHEINSITATENFILGFRLGVRIMADRELHHKLTSRDLQKLYKDLMERGRIQKRSGKGNPGLSSTTVRSVHLTLHCAFERAVKERLIPRNPTDDCIAPKVQKVEIKTLLPEHLKAYLNAANARGVLPMFYLELVSGLRKGELVALLWSDLDAEHKTISVSKQYVRNPSGEVMLSRPKTETSVWQVSIPQDAVDLLIQEHNRHPDNQYMFPSPVTGEMYHPDSVVKLHEKILKDAELEHIFQSICADIENI